MDHLLAKTKGSKGDFFKVISNQSFFKLPEDLNNTTSYNYNYILEDDEWFKIDQFSEKDFCIDFLRKSFISTEYNQITVQDYSNINYLIAYQSKIYYFQKLSSNHVIQKKFFAISDAPTLIDNTRIIIINDFPDAIYDKEADIFYFKRLSLISAIFKGIEVLHKEATQEETEFFLANDFIKLSDNYSANDVKTMNRKRIAMAMDTLQNFSIQEKNSIFTYIKEYCQELNFDEELKNFSISSEDELKKLLYGIEQRYYTTRIGNEKRLANSIMKLG